MSSLSSIAKEILSRFEEMEKQLGENWTLKDIKGALMDDMRAMIQDELRQALTGLIPPTPAATILIAPIIPSVADAPPTATVPTTIAIPPTVIVLPTIVLTDDSKEKPSNNVKVMPTVQMKKKKVRNARKKNYQTGGTQ